MFALDQYSNPEFSQFCYSPHLSKSLNQLHIVISYSLVHNPLSLLHLKKRTRWVFYHVTHAFSVNQYSLITSMSKNFLLETGVKSEIEVTATGLEAPVTLFINEHLTIMLVKACFII